MTRLKYLDPRDGQYKLLPVGGGGAEEVWVGGAIPLGGQELWIDTADVGGGAPPGENVSAGGDLTGVYPNPQIAPGVIVNADIAAGAQIAQSKVANLPTDLASKWTMWTGTQAAYDALGTKDPNTLYVIV